MFDWFDQRTACPECGHHCFDHAACREDPECSCSHRCHFEVYADLSADDATPSGSRTEEGTG